MSSLIFYTEENQVLVATDTLATSYEGKPFMFTTKTLIVPHLRMIACATGAGGFLGKWFVQINDRMVVRGIDHLDYHTPDSLAALWREHKEECSIPDDGTVTVYHFGFSEEESLIHSYAYRSTNNFRSEPFLQYGLGVKPECQVPERYELPKDIRKMMDEQRAIQSSRPVQERVYIGGEIQIYHLTTSGFSVYTIDRFNDYNSDEQAIYENFRSNPNDT
jgi:hypothetical protein